MLLTRQRICRVPADHVVFFRSFSSAVQVVLRWRVLRRFVGAFPLFCRGWQDNSRLTRAGHGHLAFRYGPSRVRAAPHVPRAGMSSCTAATFMRIVMALVGWLQDEPGRAVRAADAQELLSHACMPAALRPDGSFVLL